MQRRTYGRRAEWLPFGQEAAPVAFVFTHHRFDDGGCNAAHIAAQSQHVFQHRRIALVRHGGGTYLAHEERFFQFKNLGVLQREDFVVDTADRTGANCKCAHELSLVVASNVPSNRRAFKPRISIMRFCV